MAYTPNENALLAQAIDETSTTQKAELGTIIRCKDPTYGPGEFIYLQGVASTVVGSVVVYDGASHVTELAPVGSNLPRPVAIAMSANVANQYGWYQISGRAVVVKTNTVSLADGAAVGVLTAGKIAGTGSGKEVSGAIVVAVASAKSDVTSVQVAIDRPRMQGRVT